MTITYGISMHYQKFFIITIILLISGLSYADTEVEGDVSGVWDIDGSPYIVTDHITVQEGDELVIEPGVEVLFNGGTKLDVQNGGVLTAVGEEGNMIIFKNRWQENEFNWTGISIGSDCEVSYCVIEMVDEGDANAPLTGNGQDMIISNNIIRGNGWVIMVGALEINGSAIISDNSIHHNGSSGDIISLSGDISFIRNTLRDNQLWGQEGSIISLRGSVNMSDNIFSRNSGFPLDVSIVTINNAGRNFSMYNNLFYGNISENRDPIITLTLLNSHLEEFNHNVLFGNGEDKAIKLSGDCQLDVNNSIIWGFGEDFEIGEDASLEAQYSLIENYEDMDIEIGDGMIDDDPLFVDSENGDFHLQEDSPCVDAGDPDSPRDPDWSRTDIGLYFGEIPVIDEHTISMHEGWNLISFHIEPFTDDVIELFAPLTEGEAPVLLLLKNQRGHFYSPAHDFNGIESWNYRQGYQVRLSEATDLTFGGHLIEPDRAIEVVEGWQIVAYYPTWEMRSEEAFVSIADNIQILKNGQGQFYVPAHDFNNMDACSPGQGYKLRMREADNLVYPAEENRAAALPKIIELQHFGRPRFTTGNMSLLLETDNLSSGAEIAAFTSDGLFVGSGVVDDNGKCGLALWENDENSDQIDGLQNNEIPTFKIWDGTNEYKADLTVIEGEISYETDGFAIGKIAASGVATPTEFTLSEPYPNPFNDRTSIKFSIPGASDVRIEMIDISGRLVTTLTNEPMPTGYHTISIDAKGLASGVYWIRITTGSGQMAKRVVLLR